MCGKIIVQCFIFLGISAIAHCGYQCVKDDFESFQNCYKNVDVKLHDTGEEALNRFHRMDIRCSLISKIFECLEAQRKNACDNQETHALGQIFGILSPVKNPFVSCNNTGIIRQADYNQM
ncbi:uncharacterized protein [Parasteatoda tepidariorum]|uniref:uncharacterized protein n=1 Tax=Parasteatoda tepidariorum TaxID=114398 RepID=UPI001C7199CE|nr:uncharacterized protein LOC107437586 [Parasteatoda tepidariorum]